MDSIVYPAQEWLGANATPHLVTSGVDVRRAINSDYATAAARKVPVVEEVSEEHYRYLYNRMVATEAAANL